MVEILQTIFGSVKIAMNGFTYVKNKHGPNGRIYWRCESRDCLGSCTTDELYLAGEPMQGRSSDFALIWLLSWELLREHNFY